MRDRRMRNVRRYIKHKKMKGASQDIGHKRMEAVRSDERNRRLKLSGMIGALAAMLMLGGCTLAREDADMVSGQDRLIGVFITAEYLDLFDFDSYLSDHAGTLMRGGEHIVTEGSEYEGKLYADIDKHGSEDPLDWDVSFGDVEGMRCFAPTWTDEKGESFHASQIDEKLCDVHLGYTVTDDGEDMELSATIYVIPGSGYEDCFYYANPVYQTAKGEIYAVSGQGFGMGEASAEGELMSTNISESSSYTENGEKKAETCSVDIGFSVKFEPIRITLLQMSEDNQVLKYDDYTPGTLPEKIQAEKGTAYFMIQTEKRNPEGGSVTERDIYEYDKDEEVALETFYVTKHGILGKQSVEIQWDTKQER